MVDSPPKMLREYAMPDASSTSASIVRPSVQANNFELKPALIHIVQQDQFGGSPVECPLEHLANFLEKCDTIKINGVSEDAIRLRGAHASNDCLNFEQAQYVSNYNRSQNDPYSNTYNPGWKNHRNFSWRDKGNQGNNLRPQNPPGFPQRQQPQQERPSWELDIEKLANATSKRIITLENKVDQLANSNKNVEFQLGQLANAINSRNQGTLPSQTEVNPKEQCKVVTLRSGKTLDDVTFQAKAKEVIVENVEVEPEKQLELSNDGSNPTPIPVNC
uniref:Uncharacterized protein n=1 Tax=Chenopodium quinoa TaxID=63459 RepID=A0A803N3K9_CHEQI